MKSKRKNIARKVITTLALILLMGSSVSFGVGYSKQITAWFYNIQVKLDGRYLSFSKEPFIYDGTVYIPLRDVSQNLGLAVTWDDATKTVNLASTNTYNNTPVYYNNSNIITSNKSIQDIEDELNRDYDEYTDGDKDLEFTYELSNLNGYSSYVKVKMEGDNFKRDDSAWDDRGEDDFQDFIEDIAELVANALDNDAQIYVYDKNSKTVGKYKYDGDLEVTSEYGDSDGDIDDLEDDLNDDCDKYEDDNKDLKFDYKLTEKSSYIKVEMEGDFDRDDDDWQDRDEGDFQDFIEDIIDKICDEFDDMDIKIYIDDENGDETAEYIYDEGDDYDDFDADEYGDDDLDTIEDKLNDDYDTYRDDNEDLEFEYSLTEKSDYIKVTMKGQDFDKDDSDWTDRDKSDFKNFAEDVAKEVYDEIDDIDVKIYVYDKNGDSAIIYKYDESKDEFDED